MIKCLYLFGLVVIIFVVSGCTNNQNKIISTDTNNDCAGICAHTKATCAEFMAEEECKNQCVNWDRATKDKIKSASDCSGMPAKPNDKIIESIPEINEPDLPSAKNDCEAACNKYVIACLTLVPNASEALFSDGYNSCLGECVKWDTKKVDCMITAFNCEAMTNVCGL